METSCDKCKVVDKICRSPEGHGPAFCPTTTKKHVIEAAKAYYQDPEVGLFARNSSIQEAACYADRERKPYVMNPIKPRILEIIEFAQRMEYKKLGVAYCGGVTHEACEFVSILEKHGFEVVAVSCKVGGIPKEFIGVKDEEKINIGHHESMCNPIAQALILNDEETDFNILMCLCVGHDALFLKYAERLTTIFAVKDRVTGHNPMAALYTANSYYQRLKKLEFGSKEELKARLVADGGEDENGE
jgi:uncharacterized metal-binding protein